ncbi:hypothetical protein DMENIID0001_005620 [Sergentomyia squamirostris]
MHLKLMHRGFPSLVTGNIECQICQKICQGVQNLTKHIQKSHPDETSEYECSHCGKKWGSLSNLTKHMKTHLTNVPIAEIPIDSIPRQNVCEETETVVETEEIHSEGSHEFEGTVDEFHSEDQEKDGGDFEVAALPSLEAFKCAYCEKKYKSKKLLQIHLTKIHRRCPRQFPESIEISNDDQHNTLTKNLSTFTHNMSFAEQVPKLFLLDQHILSPSEESHQQHCENPENEINNSFLENPPMTIKPEVSLIFNVEHVESMCETLQQEGDMDKLASFLDSLSQNELMESNESILRARAFVAYHRGLFHEVYSILKSHCFTSKYHSELQSLWYKAHYTEVEKLRGRSLGAVEKFRVRKKYPLPFSIWNGEETMHYFTKRGRNILKDFYTRNRYPTHAEKKVLAKEIGLDLTQVSNWFKNQRQRSSFSLEKTTNEDVKHNVQQSDITELNVNASELDESILPDAEPMERVPRLQCVNCHRVFSKVFDLRKHIADVHREYPYDCSDSSKTIGLQDIYHLLVELNEKVNKMEQLVQDLTFRNNAKDHLSTIMPLKNVSEMVKFNELLSKKHVATAFKQWVRTSKVIDVMSDDLITALNLSGRHGKICLKDQKFFKMWKDVTILDSFEKTVKHEIFKAKNRLNQNKMRLKKKSREFQVNGRSDNGNPQVHADYAEEYIAPDDEVDSEWK